MDEERRYFLFGLTVGELGFIFFFIMLLIAFFEISDRDEELRSVSLEREAETKALAVLKAALPPGVEVDLDSVFASLAKLERVTADLDRASERNSVLQDQVEQLASQLESYKKLRDFVSRETGTDRISETDLQKLTDLVDMRIELEEALGELGIDTTDFKDGVVELAERYSDLRGQLKFLRRRGGLDLPPCWPDDQGRAEYTFDVRIFADRTFELSRSSRIPARRLDDYEKLPKVREITSDRLTASRFDQLAQPILELSNSNECRYFVTIAFDSIPEACRFTFAVEKYFYKFVSPRDQSACSQ